MRRIAPRFGLALLVLLGSAPGEGETTDIQPAVGHRAPDFTLRDPHGKPVQLSRILGEKAVLLNFWATWCPPCLQEMPTMEQAYRSYKAKGLEILAVSIDFGDEAEMAAKVKEFMADLKLTFPALLDPRSEVIRKYRVIGIPTTFLIDRQGVIRMNKIGYEDWDSAEIPKKDREPSEIAMRCHLLLGVPLVIAGLFIFLPWTTALPIALVLGLGSVVIAYYSTQALRQPVTTGKEAMTGSVGEAVSNLAPTGLVRLGSELWVSEASEPISQGARVQILEVNGAKLRVRPWRS